MATRFSPERFTDLLARSIHYFAQGECPVRTGYTKSKIEVNVNGLQAEISLDVPWANRLEHGIEQGYFETYTIKRGKQAGKTVTRTRKPYEGRRMFEKGQEKTYEILEQIIKGSFK